MATPVSNGPVSRVTGRLALAALPALVSAVLLLTTNSQANNNAAATAVVLGVADGLLAFAVAVAMTLTLRRRIGETAFIAVGFPVIFGLYYGPSSLGWAVGAHVQAGARAAVPVSALKGALTLCYVALIAWAIGFVVFGAWKGRRTPQAVRRRSRLAQNVGVPRVEAVLTLYAVGLAARLVTIAMGSFGYITKDLSGAIESPSPWLASLGRLENLTLVAVVLLTLIVALPNPTSGTARRALIATLALEAVFGLASGMKSTIILRAVAVFAAYAIASRRMPWRSILVSILPFIVLITFMKDYRSVVRTRSEGTTVGFQGALDLLGPTLSRSVDSLSPSAIGGTMTSFYFERFRGIDGPAVVRYHIPSSRPFISYWKSATEPISVFVPRAVWPDKPVYIDGLLFAREFFAQDAATFNSFTPTLVGDLYWRGGYVIVIGTMFALGVICRWVSLSMPAGLDPRYLAILIPTGLELLNLETTLRMLPVNVLQAMVVSLLAVRWATAAQRTERVPGSRPLRTLGRGFGEPIVAVNGIRQSL